MTVELGKILVVDDEPKYVRAVKFNLEASGYQVVTASDGAAAVELVHAEKPDLIILDLRMPVLDGYEACRRIRQFSQAPVIMLTALAEDHDKVRGLDLGADDYLTKPFSAEELLARIRAVLRRKASHQAVAGRPGTPEGCLQAGDLRIDFTHQTVYRNGAVVPLTVTELKVLLELARHAGRVLVIDYLIEQVWGQEYVGQNRLAWQVIHRLRQKLEPDPRRPAYLLTESGVGYKFQVPNA